ncbi:hypothetical protein R6242_21555 [Iodobacter sp. CM08]|uniref:hypothetical protein n=1 Tax=Iodobacter sp. CM08 TaxID=3085902 RepID=UPI00298187F9|nr:hypothetical protein [Iodobacter sp. CM08]MDW5419164.1 hypothetical protein [Iodobacter sp. CM08]
MNDIKIETLGVARSDDIRMKLYNWDDHLPDEKLKLFRSYDGELNAFIKVNDSIGCHISASWESRSGRGMYSHVRGAVYDTESNTVIFHIEPNDIETVKLEIIDIVSKQSGQVFYEDIMNIKSNLVKFVELFNKDYPTITASENYYGI